MSLPPLPEPNVEYVSGHRDPIVSYDKEQMQAYGQACRDAGLEEAAQVCDLHADGDNDATYCASKIRSLK